MDLKIELVKQESRFKEVEAKLRRQVEILESKAAEEEGKSWTEYLF